MLSFLGITGCGARDGRRSFNDDFEDNPLQLSDRDDLRRNAPQLSSILDDEEIAVMTTNYGVIYIRFFPEQAPVTVENFITHSRNGYYDGLTFHRVINNFMIQGGCPLGTGMGGTTIWGHGIGVEWTESLVHIRGALSMANADDPRVNRFNTTGSQFFIIQRPTIGMTESRLRRESHVVDGELIQAYLNNGGSPHLDGIHTVFGQVFKGMDVVDRIAHVPVVAAQPGDAVTTPADPVIIEKIEIMLYKDVK
jgi:peptidyl-prolyl cis-trans isomerase B (cyclophilin B)